MSEVLSLAAMSAVALTEGLKFLYNQAGELLKARRERGQERATDTPAVVAEPAVLPLPDAARAERFARDLRALRADLHEFVSGVDQVDPADGALVGRIDALRRVIEAVYGTPVVFDGEARRDGPLRVHGRIDVEAVAGYVAAVRAERPAGQILGEVRADRVEPGGEAIGVDIRDPR
jgi:hypothetical protein